MFRFIFNLMRAAFIAALGTAIAAKFLLESNADPETEEIDLVAIFDGVELVSSANPFYGGKILTMFGGVMIDLRKATPAPTGITLDLAVVMGGVNLIIPEGWQMRYIGELKVFAGGVADHTRPSDDEDVPTVTLKGTVAFGGLNVATKPPVEAVV